jgi:hypothetical protein
MPIVSHYIALVHLFGFGSNYSIVLRYNPCYSLFMNKRKPILTPREFRRLERLLTQIFADKKMNYRSFDEVLRAFLKVMVKKEIKQGLKK